MSLVHTSSFPFAVVAAVVLVGVLAAGGCEGSRGVDERDRSETEATLRELTAQVASLEARVSELSGVEERLGSAETRIREVERRTPGIGYHSLRWRIQGLTSLSNPGLTVEDDDSSAAAGARSLLRAHFTFRGERCVPQLWWALANGEGEIVHGPVLEAMNDGCTFTGSVPVARAELREMLVGSSQRDVESLARE